MSSREAAGGIHRDMAVIASGVQRYVDEVKRQMMTFAPSVREIEQQQ